MIVSDRCRRPIVSDEATWHSVTSDERLSSSGERREIDAGERFNTTNVTTATEVPREKCCTMTNAPATMAAQDLIVFNTFPVRPRNVFPSLRGSPSGREMAGEARRARLLTEPKEPRVRWNGNRGFRMVASGSYLWMYTSLCW